MIDQQGCRMVLSVLFLRSTFSAFRRLHSQVLLSHTYSAVLLFALAMAPCAVMSASTENGAHGALPQQKLGPNDLVAIEIYNAKELSLQLRVSEDGNVRPPMLTRTVPAAGLLPSQLERSICAAYVDEGILVNPTITISVLEYASKPVSVIGAVRQPITFHAERPLTLLEAITRAGGFSDDAGSYLLLSSRAQGDGEQPILTERILISDIIESAGATADLRLVGGEELRVPEAGKIYIMGNVRKPGSYRIPNDYETTVMKALALSEGLLPNSTREAFIYRRASDGSKTEIPLNLKQLMARKAADVVLLQDDVLYIPENGRKKATMTAMEKAVAFGSATLSGVLVWGVAR